MRGERLLSYLYIFPLIAMGAWHSLIHPRETPEQYATRTRPAPARRWTDGTD